jgi:hypothetical protein
VKIDVDPSGAEGLKEYATNLSGSKLVLDNGASVEILKADVKERKGEAVLIFRYQLIV